jgi:inner membrane protein
MVVLPIVLAALMTWIGRTIDARRHRARQGPPIVPRELLIVAAISIWSHPLFDLMNTYGVRLLMPFSSRWFYGDTLFIVDPWIWAALGIGTFVSLRRARAIPVGAGSPGVMARAERPARIAIAGVAIYIAAMFLTSRVGRSIVERQAVASGRAPSRRVMVAPEAANPIVRSVVRDLESSYEVGRLTWSPAPRYVASSQPIPKLSGPAIDAALATRAGSQFALWSRFPFAEVADSNGTSIVRLDDARYSTPGGRSFASVTAVVNRP